MTEQKKFSKQNIKNAHYCKMGKEKNKRTVRDLKSEEREHIKKIKKEREQSSQLHENYVYPLMMDPSPTCLSNQTQQSFQKVLQQNIFMLSSSTPQRLCLVKTIS